MQEKTRDMFKPANELHQWSNLNRLNELHRSLKTMPHGADKVKVAALLQLPPEAILDFSSNINPLAQNWGITAAAFDAMKQLSTYPEPEPRRFLARLSEKEIIPQEQLIAGNGGADLIFRTACALRFSEEFKGRQDVLIAEPCFGEYRAAFSAAGFHILSHRLLVEEQFDVNERILPAISDQLRAVILCHPNNPTGRSIRPEILSQIAERCREKGVALLLDLCFLDFLPEKLKATKIALAPFLEQRSDFPTKKTDSGTKGRGPLGGHTPAKHLSVVSFHSLTKLYAIPALRIGWLYCSDGNLCKNIKALTPPWQVSAPAAAAAEAAMKVPAATIRACLEELDENKSELAEELRKFGAKEIQGEANYLFFQHPESLLQARLLLGKRAILIRSCANYEGLGEGWFRIAVKSAEENAAFIEQIHELDIN